MGESMHCLLSNLATSRQRGSDASIGGRDRSGGVAAPVGDLFQTFSAGTLRR
jgi:hypothetical protein